MKKYKQKYRLAIISSLIFIFSCQNSQHKKDNNIYDYSALPYFNEASFTPYWLESDDESLKTFHKIPSFKLVNQDGDTITEKTFENKIYVTNFFFATCPGICPKMTENMGILQRKFKDDSDVLLLSHTVTPEIDSVEALNIYAKNHRINSNKWHLVTGDRKQIYVLGRKAYMVEEDLGENRTENDFLHTENFVLIDKNKHIRGIYNGLNKTSINQLIIDISELENEN